MFSPELPSDCSGWFDKGQTNSGIYAVKPNQSEAFNVYCDMSSGRSNLNTVFIILSDNHKMHLYLKHHECRKKYSSSNIVHCMTEKQAAEAANSCVSFEMLRIKRKNVCVKILQMEAQQSFSGGLTVRWILTRPGKSTSRALEIWKVSTT